ncbi:MAG: RNA-binding cell elongation regulator Jag/EloR [Actinomycetota bacterium]|nr:protein jag [Actinomycetota bacterium]
MTREPVETSGKTVVDAIDSALDMLGATEDEVEIKILAEGGYSELARVRVKMRDERSPEDVALAAREAEEPAATEQVEFTNEELNDQADAAIDFLGDLLEKMDFDVDVEEDILGGEVVVDLIGEDMALLIGRHGSTLEALQDLTRSAVKHQTGHWPRITVDVEGYQERRRENLTQRAWSLADKAKSSGEPVDMPPMSPAERKIIHEVIQAIEGVRTESEGSGQDRHIVIYPA